MVGYADEALVSHQVSIRMPLAHDPEIVAGVLGESPIPVTEEYPVQSPWITIDGRIHRPASDYLRQHCARRPNLATARRIAGDLAAWLDCLCNHWGIYPFDDARDPVFAATEDHFASCYRTRQYQPGLLAMTSESWRHSASSIKRLYEYCQRAYQHPPPFQIVGVVLRSGARAATIASYRPRRRRTGSAGTPLTPEFAELLVMGALRVDLLGRQDFYRAADRDAAIISLALATGMRRSTLANFTTYELPPDNSLPFTTTPIASRITKGDAGGDALTFCHRLPSVRDYIAGSRKDAIARHRYQPAGPLTIESGNQKSVSFVDPSTGEHITRLWDDVDPTVRRRLTHEDGTSPVLFLNENTGAPLSHSSLQHPVDAAANFVRQRIEPRFPEPLRLHDLRHTYAVHLIVRRVASDATAGGIRRIA